METPSKTLSAEIRGHLAKHRIARSELAGVLGISEMTLYRHLEEETPWPLDRALMACQWAGLSLETCFESSHVAGLSA